MTQKRLIYLVVWILISVLLAQCAPATETVVTPDTEEGVTAPEIPEVPEVEIVFGHLPYIDHSWAVIGIRKGWFTDVGITILPGPDGDIAGPGTQQKIISGEMHVSQGQAATMPSQRANVPMKNFCNSNVFQGFAIMAQPNQGYKTVDDFVAEGVSSEEAIRLTVQQMKGKKFTYPAVSIPTGFIPLALEKGGLTLEDMETIVAEEADSWRNMIAGNADFQSGGVPSRLTLEARGFIPIITSFDLAKYAEPSAESIELRAVFQDGWMASDEWLEENWETALRMCSVTFRTTEFMNTNEAEAIAIHMPFLNSIAGTELTEDDFIVAYRSLNPFLTFEDQAKWYIDDSYPLNEKYLVGSFIKMNEEQGLIEPDSVKVEDVTVAGDIYRELVEFKNKSDELMAEAQNEIDRARAEGKDISQAEQLLQQANFFYTAYNYLDSYRFAESALAWAKYSTSN